MHHEPPDQSRNRDLQAARPPAQLRPPTAGRRQGASQWMTTRSRPALTTPSADPPTAVHPTTEDGDYRDPGSVHATATFPPQPGSELGLHQVQSIPVEVVYPIASNAVVKLELSLPLFVYGASPDHSIITYQADLVVAMRESDLSNLIYMAFQASVSEHRFDN